MSRIAIVLLVAAFGCGPLPLSEREVELRRSRFTASLESLTVEQAPLTVEAESGATAVAASPGPAVRTDAILEVEVSSSSEDPLPGVTVDVEHLDAARMAKERATFWVDTSALGRGESARVTHVLEDVAWETGDAYTVSVRSPIPVSERPGYREFGRP